MAPQSCSKTSALLAYISKTKATVFFVPSVVTGTPEIEAPGLGVTQTTEIWHLTF